MHLIEIFHIENQDTVTLGSACSSCSSGCEPVTRSIKETVETFQANYTDLAEVTKHVLTQETTDSLAERLQEVYKNSNEGLIITGSNIHFIMKKLSPIIAIDGYLVANNYIPDANELKSAIDNGQHINNRICS